MKLEDIEAIFNLAIGELTLLGQGARIEAWAQFHGRKLIAIAKASKKLCRDIDFCGAGAIDGEFGSDVSESYYETMDAFRELEKE